MNMIPPKLKAGDGVRVITPARSFAMPWINDEMKEKAIQRFKKLGLNLSFA